MNNDTVTAEPVAWIAKSPQGRIYHFAKLDGWEVHAVQHEVTAERRVSLPMSADEAELMAKVGIQYLEQNAPDRLKTGTGSSPKAG